jgi:hypothetical protein
MKPKPMTIEQSATNLINEIVSHMTNDGDETKLPGIAQRHLTTLTKSLEEENRRLRRHVVSFLSMIENGILSYPEHHESRVKYTTDKAKETLTKPT